MATLPLNLLLTSLELGRFAFQALVEPEFLQDLACEALQFLVVGALVGSQLRREFPEYARSCHGRVHLPKEDPVWVFVCPECLSYGSVLRAKLACKSPA